MCSIKRLFFVGDSHRVLSGFPYPVQRHVGFALYQAQMGNKHPVYVLHAFQKKSKKRGIATPRSEIELVKQRLQRAIEIDREQEAL